MLLLGLNFMEMVHVQVVAKSLDHFRVTLIGKQQLAVTTGGKTAGYQDFKVQIRLLLLVMMARQSTLAHMTTICMVLTHLLVLFAGNILLDLLGLALNLLQLLLKIMLSLLVRMVSLYWSLTISSIVVA